MRLRLRDHWRFGVSGILGKWAMCKALRMLDTFLFNLQDKNLYKIYTRQNVAKDIKFCYDYELDCFAIKS